MHDSPLLPTRRTVRLKTFDYSQPGAYFLTICAHNHKCLFGRAIWGQMGLNALGTIVNECWLEIPRHFPNAALAAHIVMPNHLHGIVVIRERARRAVPLQNCDVGGKFGSPVTGSIPTIIASFKSAVSRRIRETAGKPALRVWQRNYYEHVIRNEADFQKTCEYIRQNPAPWDFDEENPQRSRA